MSSFYKNTNCFMYLEHSVYFVKMWKFRCLDFKGGKKSFEIKIKKLKKKLTTCSSFFNRCGFSIDFPPCCLRVYFWFLLPAARILKPLPPLARRNRCGARFLWFLGPMAPPAVLLRETNMPKTLSYSSFSSFLGRTTLDRRDLSYLEPSTLFLHIRIS